MTFKDVGQMHIDVRVQLQQLAANRNRKLEDGTIDWALNRAQNQLVDNCVIPKIDGTARFEINRQRREQVSMLIKKLTHTAAKDGDNYLCRMPADMLYLLSDSSNLSLKCKGDTITETPVTERITIVGFPPSEKSAPPLYETLQVIYNGTDIFNLANLQTSERSGYTGLSSTEEHFYIRDLVIDTLNRKGYNVYWESLGSIYAPNSLIFVTASAAPTILVRIDGVEYTSTNTDNTVLAVNSSGTMQLRPNTMVRADIADQANATPFFGTSHISPVSVMEGGFVRIYGNNSFIVSGVDLTYIRKPSQISLTLGSNCELHASAHKTICEMAVEELQQRIGDPRWQDTASQNLVKKES